MEKKKFYLSDVKTRTSRKENATKILQVFFSRLHFYDMSSSSHL